MRDDELKRYKSMLEDNLLRISMEIDRRQSNSIAPSSTHTAATAATAHSNTTGRPHSYPHSQSGMLSAIQSMRLQSLPSPPNHLSAGASATASSALPSNGNKHATPLPQNPSPPPAPSPQHPNGPAARSKGSSPGSGKSSAVLSSSIEQTSVDSMVTAALQGDGPNPAADPKGLRYHVKRTRSNGSESAFASNSSVPLSAAPVVQVSAPKTAQPSPHPGPSQRKSNPSAGLHPSVTPQIVNADSIPQLSEAVEDEELVHVFYSGGRMAQAPIQDQSNGHHTITSRTTSRGGAAAPNDKMFSAVSASPGTVLQMVSRAATPSATHSSVMNHSYSPSESGHSHSHFVAHANHSITSTPSSRPHSRMSGASGPVHSESASAVNSSSAPDSVGYNLRASGSGRSSSLSALKQRKKVPPALADLVDHTTFLHHSKERERDSAPRASFLRPVDTEVVRPSAHSLLFCVPKNLSANDWVSSSSSIRTEESSNEELSSELEREREFDAIARAGSIDKMIVAHRGPNGVVGGRDALVPSPFSAFDDLSQGSQSINSNRSLTKRSSGSGHKKIASASLAFVPRDGDVPSLNGGGDLQPLMDGGNRRSATPSPSALAGLVVGTAATHGKKR